MIRRRPKAPKRVVSFGKVCEGPLRLRKERSKSLVGWRKWLKETCEVSEKATRGGWIGVNQDSYAELNLYPKPNPMSLSSNSAKTV
jgi:hypothetical protein